MIAAVDPNRPPPDLQDRVSYHVPWSFDLTFRLGNR
jgi:hypothetical protein